jgi:hypothetical protein
MAVDSSGNAQIDFVWGNIPMQPNYSSNTMNTFRQGYSYAPGDGEGEFYIDGHATVNDWGTPSYFPADYLFPSQFLDAQDSHVNALRLWNGFPDNNPNTGFNLTVNWWEETPAMEYPNILGKTVKDALADLRECGVAENFLSDALTDSENPYDYGTWLKDSGIVLWRYLTPETQIGTHWDGSPWYASEAEGLVIYANNWVGYQTAVGSYDVDTNVTTSDPTNPNLAFPYWLTFCAIQTTDPNKNSWNWWN